MAFPQCFLRPPELTKIVQQKFSKILLHQIAPFGLANWTRKVFPVFPRNIPYRARPKGPPFQFFSALWDFFPEILFHQILFTLQFFADLRQNGCWKIPKGSPFSFFWHCDMAPTWAGPGLFILFMMKKNNLRKMSPDTVLWPRQNSAEKCMNFYNTFIIGNVLNRILLACIKQFVLNMSLARYFRKSRDGVCILRQNSRLKCTIRR